MKFYQTLTLSLAFFASIELGATEKDLNVLMIIVDDLAPVISAYGGPVSTPALDRLAQRGVRFMNNYANAPVCGASRASMLSGLAPTSSRFLSFDSRLDQDAADAVSMPAYFRQNGWHTLANGKVFDVIADSSNSWSEPVWNPDDDWYGKQPDGRGEHLQAAYIEPISGDRMPYSERLDVADTDYPDGQVAAKSVNDLHRLAEGDAPFFMMVGFRKPHLPFNAPERYWQSAGPPNDMLPLTWWQPTTDLPFHAQHRSPELRSQYDALPFFGDPNDAEASEIVNAYHAAVRYADAQVGLVLEGLAASAAADDTIVVVMGDHGFLLGEQRMWTKHALLEPALRTPLIIAHPSISGGLKTRSVTDLLDVFPTVAELAGLEVPPGLQGVSLRSLLENPALVERRNKQGSISRWMHGESIRHLNHRYTRWFDENDETVDEMLFDLKSDPFEQINLASKPEYADVVADLAMLLSSQRSGPVWSAALDAQYSRWQLVSSAMGGVLLVAVTYPVRLTLVLLTAVFVLVVAVLLFRRRRKESVAAP